MHNFIRYTDLPLFYYPLTSSLNECSVLQSGNKQEYRNYVFIQYKKLLYLVLDNEFATTFVYGTGTICN